MPRKVIIGVIGATHREDEPVDQWVLDLAWSIGHEIGTRDAILLTGGEPNAEDRSVKSFAMLGCQEARLDERPSGRMISVLSGCPSDDVDSAPGTRRVVLQTKLSSMGRNPITGCTPDRLIVLRHGRVGTLVELAFALRWKDPVAPVFVRSIEHLRQADASQKGKQDDTILAGIGKAIAEFRADGTGIPEIDPVILRDTLSNCLTAQRDVAVAKAAVDVAIVKAAVKAAIAKVTVDAAIAKAAVDAAMARVPEQLELRFDGLPSTANNGDRVLKAKFKEFVEQLSNLQPGTVF